MRRTKVMVLAVLLALVAACGGGEKSTNTAAGGSTATPTARASDTCASAGSTRFAKTRFVLHAGLAFGSFHRYIYKPYQAGAFKAGAPGRAKALAKAAAAATVTAVELRNARKAAAGDPTLCKLVEPLDRLSALVGTVAPALGAGNFSPSQLLDLNNRIEEFKGNSSSSGAPITER